MARSRHIQRPVQPGPAPNPAKERPAVSSPRSSPGWRWGFRLAAPVLIPLLLLTALEAVLRLMGCGYPTSFFLAQRASGKEMLIENRRFGWRFFDPALARTPRPLLLPAAKSSNTFRVFVLGESAAYGDPQPDFGLPRMLEVLLADRYPEMRFEVVNAALTAINSHVILPIARDCARSAGDLWVIYAGHNEVVGPFGAGTVFSPEASNLAMIRAGIALKGTRTGQCFSQLLAHWKSRPAGEKEWGGLQMFIRHQVRQDDARMEAVYRHFASNLADILQVGTDRNIKIIVSTVVSNLRDCAPFASLHRTDLPPEQENEWNRLYQAGIHLQEAGQAADAATLFQRAGEIDDHFADLQFRWGLCCLAVGQQTAAGRHLTQARNHDALRVRADSRINNMIRQIAAERSKNGVVLVDAEKEFARLSPAGLPGKEMLYEHVHLNFDGNYQLARLLAEQVAGMLPKSIAPTRFSSRPDWLPAGECAARLGWTDWNRYETAATVLIRITDPPFTSQLNHGEQYRRLQNEMEQLLPAIQPESLRHALLIYQRAVSRRPDDWVLAANLGRLQHKLGTDDRALESWQRVSQLLPHYEEAYCQQGILLAQQGRPHEAMTQFQEALRLKPDSVKAIDGLGLVLAQAGRHQEAVRQYEQALRLDPDYAEAHLNLAATLTTLGQPEAARDHIQKALAHKANNPAALNTLGKVCLSQGWINEAIVNFTAALRLDPTDALIHFNLGSALASARRTTEAQQHYAEAVRLQPTFAEAHFRLGFELGRGGHDAEAIGQFAEAVRLKPELMEAHLNLGLALVKQRRLDEAARQFQEALRLDPTNAIAQRQLEAIGRRRSASP